MIQVSEPASCMAHAPRPVGLGIVSQLRGAWLGGGSIHSIGRSQFSLLSSGRRPAARGPLGAYVHGEARLSPLVLITFSHLSALGPEVEDGAPQRGDSVLMLSRS